MRKADSLPPYGAVVKKSRSLNFLDPSGSAWPVTGVLYLLHLLAATSKEFNIKTEFLELILLEIHRRQAEIAFSLPGCGSFFVDIKVHNYTRSNCNLNNE